jgi:hypothetical protein
VKRGVGLFTHGFCVLFFFGEKHHGGWGLLNVRRGVGLFTHITQSYESYERKIRKI